MNNYFLIYDDCCFYEIVLLGYFLRYSSSGEQPMFYCSKGGRDINTAEGFTVKADIAVEDIAPEEVRALIIPGGPINNVMGTETASLLTAAADHGAVIGAICGGVELLEKCGILEGRSSVHTTESDVTTDGKIVTALPNAYVDFAVEVGKLLDVFVDEADIEETLDFFKFHKKVN